MRKSRACFIIVGTALITNSAVAQSPSCALPNRFDHVTKSGTKQVRTALHSLFFTAPLAVNTDGAPNSYHPDDPSGNRGLAINTICNGANAVLPNGSKISYDKCPELIVAFKEARQTGWTAPGKPRMDFYGIASVNGKPCIASDGDHSGYMVSTTSQLADPARPVCDQRRYLNALEIPFSIYPGHRNFTSRGVGRKDVVVIHNPDTGKTEFGVIGDRGPARGLGEVSIYYAKYLRNIDRMPKTRKETYAFAVPRAHVLVLGNEEIQPPYTLSKIRSEGAAALERWGGMSRFKACIAEHGG